MKRKTFLKYSIPFSKLLTLIVGVLVAVTLFYHFTLNSYTNELLERSAKCRKDATSLNERSKEYFKVCEELVEEYQNDSTTIARKKAIEKRMTVIYISAKTEQTRIEEENADIILSAKRLKKWISYKDVLRRTVISLSFFLICLAMINSWLLKVKIKKQNE